MPTYGTHTPMSNTCPRLSWPSVTRASSLCPGFPTCTERLPRQSVRDGREIDSPSRSRDALVASPLTPSVPLPQIKDGAAGVSNCNFHWNDCDIAPRFGCPRHPRSPMRICVTPVHLPDPKRNAGTTRTGSPIRISSTARTSPTSAPSQGLEAGQVPEQGRRRRRRQLPEDRRAQQEVLGISRGSTRRRSHPTSERVRLSRNRFALLLARRRGWDPARALI